MIHVWRLGGCVRHGAGLLLHLRFLLVGLNVHLLHFRPMNEHASHVRCKGEGVT